MIFLDKNGYDNQLEAARIVFKKDQVLTVKEFDLGDYSSYIKFTDHNNWYNSVMFDFGFLDQKNYQGLLQM